MNPAWSNGWSIGWAVWLITLAGCLAEEPHELAKTPSPRGKWTAPMIVPLHPAVPRSDLGGIDRHALRAPRHAARSLDALAAYLASAARDERETARAIFRWIAHNVTYNAPAFFSGRIRSELEDPEVVLRRRTAVCDGFAGLFVALATRAGLQARTITGHAKGFGYRAGQGVAGPPNHAWNAVRIRGRWRLLDPTWGTGHIDGSARTFQREFQQHYFLTPAEQFIYGHFPEEPEWQLLRHPLTRSGFAALAHPTAVFFEHGLRLASHDSGAIQTGGRLTVRLQTPETVLLTATLLRNGREVKGSPVFVQRDGGFVDVYARFPRAGAYTLRLFSKSDAGQPYYEEALNYRISASTSAGAGGFPLVYKSFAERQGHLYAPIQGRLKAGTRQRFRLNVPGAQRVVAIVNGKWQYLDGTEGGFEGNLRVPRGEFILYAQFPGEKNVAGLLRFEGG